MFANLEEKYFNEDLEFSFANQHIYCLAYIINLALKKLVIKIHKSSQKRECLSYQYFISQIKKFELIDNIKTRWNSTYDMIERVLNLQQCFKDATLEISASTYPTLSYTIPIYNYLLDLIEKFLKEDSYSNDIINAINKAKLKLQKYYPTTNGPLEYFKDHDFKDETIEKYQQEIVNLWKTKYIPALNQNNNQATNNSSRLIAYIVNKRKYTKVDELIKYLQEPPSNYNIDILIFWK
ncbi:27397_t:CDS:2, partial [Dentiscutata erythropus]